MDNLIQKTDLLEPSCKTPESASAKSAGAGR
jgi:hypothetical protein